MSELVIGALTPVRQLGRGTLCEVILVEDAVGRRFALKRALAEHREKDGVQRLLRDEARVCEALAHPAIPKLIAWEDGGADGVSMVFELLDGVTLDELLGKKEALSARASLFVVDTLLGALSYVHARSVVHRDVGPHNVVATRSGDVALIDFGIAVDDDRERWTAAGALRGTLGFLSPEAVRGEAIDARADLFACGALLYRLIAGQPPFRGKGARQILDAVAHGNYTPIADVEPRHADLDRIFARCLAADPGKRFGNASEMRRALGFVQQKAPDARNELSLLVAPKLVLAEMRGPTMS